MGRNIHINFMINLVSILMLKLFIKFYHPFHLFEISIHLALFQLQKEHFLLNNSKVISQLFHLIFSYQHSVDIDPNIDLPIISDTYKKGSLEDRKDIIHNESLHHFDLYRSILVTSKNSMNWINRSHKFSSSYGSFSAISYLFNGIDTSPHSIWFEKMTGKISCIFHLLKQGKQCVPFRLTKMFENALGPYSVEGPFFSSFIAMFSDLKNLKFTLAPVLQFVTNEYTKPIFPSFYTRHLISEKLETSETVEDLYSRISMSESLNSLINVAKNEDNIVQMKKSWIPWW